MPTNIRIIHAHDFLKATPEGTLDVESSKKLLVEIAAHIQRERPRNTPGHATGAVSAVGSRPLVFGRRTHQLSQGPFPKDGRSLSTRPV